MLHTIALCLALAAPASHSDDPDRSPPKPEQVAQAVAAIEAGKFADEVVPVTIKGRKGDTVVDTDESPRADTSMEALGRLRPAFPMDARDFDQVAAAVDKAKEVGEFSGAMNAVGSIVLRPAAATSRATFDEVIETNLTTAFALVRSAGAALARGSGGSIVLMSSAAGSVGLPNHEAIAAAKGGVEGLTRAAAASLARRGVRVNALAPGLVDTPLAERITSNEKALEASKALHPMGRIGTPDEVASLVYWLLTDEGSWMTGAVLPVDGGMADVRTG